VALAPFMPDMWVKLAFAIIWCSFGLMHLVKLPELIAAQGVSRRWQGRNSILGFAVGVTGGIVASITGVGIDMIVYATLVLLYRADLKIAIPTSVVLMAFTSVVGIAVNVGLSYVNPSRYYLDPEVYANWLAAAPVVALGAPLGAFVVQLVSRKPTLLIVSLLCIGQFVWTVIHEGLSGFGLVVAIAGVLGINAIFHLLYFLGRDAAFSHDPTRSATSEREKPAAEILAAEEH